MKKGLSIFDCNNITLLSVIPNLKWNGGSPSVTHSCKEWFVWQDEWCSTRIRNKKTGKEISIDMVNEILNKGILSDLRIKD